MALPDPRRPIPNTPLWLGAGGLIPFVLLGHGLVFMAVMFVCIGLAVLHG